MKISYKPIAPVLALMWAIMPIVVKADDSHRSSDSSTRSAAKLQKINHFVVIYEENHSFDNLYGLWEGVNGLSNADPAHTLQVNQKGSAFACLPQNDVNLKDVHPIPSEHLCKDTTTAEPFDSFYRCG